MANAEQLTRLWKDIEDWNKWRSGNFGIVRIDLTEADLMGADLSGANLIAADLTGAYLGNAYLKKTRFKNAKLVGAYFKDAHLIGANLRGANLSGADLRRANLANADLTDANLSKANLSGTDLSVANLTGANLSYANLSQAWLIQAELVGTNLSKADLTDASLSKAKLDRAILIGSNFFRAKIADTIFGNSNLSEAIGLEDVVHANPSRISTDTFIHSKGKIPQLFLRGCGLSDWEIEHVKLYNPDLSNNEVNEILYTMYELRATQALQVSPLFISYNHADSVFVDKIGNSLTDKGIRYWRDIHDMKAGKMEKQIDKAIRQNPTVLLILSKHALSSEWVEHEVRTARGLERKMGRDVLCPVALDDTWKSSPWSKRLMEQITEYNILDFSTWKDDSKFDAMFRKLIDGLELFYKG